MTPQPPALIVTVSVLTLASVILPLEPDVVARLRTLPELPLIVPVVERLPVSVTWRVPEPRPVELRLVSPPSVIVSVPLVVLAASVVAPDSELVNVAEP